jgi:hypothetical protein
MIPCPCEHCRHERAQGVGSVQHNLERYAEDMRYVGDKAIKQRDQAIAERDKAIKHRDDAERLRMELGAACKRMEMERNEAIARFATMQSQIGCSCESCTAYNKTGRHDARHDVICLLKKAEAERDEAAEILNLASASPANCSSCGIWIDKMAHRHLHYGCLESLISDRTSLRASVDRLQAELDKQLKRIGDIRDALKWDP